MLRDMTKTAKWTLTLAAEDNSVPLSWRRLGRWRRRDVFLSGFDYLGLRRQEELINPQI